MLKRRALVAALVSDRPANLIAVASLGSPAWDLAASGNDARNFCFIGAMGQSAPFALGLAIAQPDKRVVVLAGDGEILMSLGALATIANRAPSNLAIVVLDNGAYEETGGQASATAGTTDLVAVARGCGIATTFRAEEEADIELLRQLVVTAPGPVFATARIANERPPMAFPSAFDGVTQINRFREAVLV